MQNLLNIFIRDNSGILSLLQSKQTAMRNEYIQFSVQLESVNVMHLNWWMAQCINRMEHLWYNVFECSVLRVKLIKMSNRSSYRFPCSIDSALAQFDQSHWLIRLCFQQQKSFEVVLAINLCGLLVWHFHNSFHKNLFEPFSRALLL